MSDYTMDNIPRTLEEDLLLDLIETPISLYTEGVDSALDVDAANYRLTSLYDKIKALSALIYMKESTILSEKKSDAIKGSIYFNKEKNSIEYFDGQAWNSNIFGSSVILDYKSINVTDMTTSVDNNGVTYAPITDITLNMEVDENQVIFLVIDGDIVDNSMYTIDPNNKKRLIFSFPITVYNNISYYVLGSESSYSGSIPRYEVVEYVSDGLTKIYPLSNNRDFVVTYKSSVLVTVDGVMLRDSEYSINASRNSIILNNPAKTGAFIEIRTQYGVVTDFRTSITYVEQIQEAKTDNQKTFQYNGVCDAVKVYWNGLRLISGKDFDFNYVQKLVVMRDEIVAKIKEGDTVIIEKELVPMSKEPMQGVMITERLVPMNNTIETSHTCNGIANIISIDNMGAITPLTYEDYYLNNNTITIIKAGLANNEIEITYLTNSNVNLQEIPQIDDYDKLSLNKIWSAYKLNKEFNGKASASGDLTQDFNTRNLHSSNNLTVDGSADVKGSINISGKIGASNLHIGNATNPLLFTDIASDSFNVNQNMNVRKDVVIYGDLRVEGVQTGAMLNQMKIDNNSFELNSNLTPSDSPVQSESGLIINRGRNGEARFSFDETDQKWKVFTTESGNLTEVSLGGHKHTMSDFESAGVPNYHTLNSTTNTSDEFYDNGDYRTEIEKVLSTSEPVKTISRFNVKKSSIVAGELDNTIQSTTIASLENYQGSYDANGNTYIKEDIFAIIEDGSIVSNSKGAMKLPSGPSNKRWENDSEFCNIPSQRFTTNLDTLSGNKWQDINGLIRYNTDEKCVEMKIDGSWVKFYKPDVAASKQSEMSFSRGRHVEAFTKTDFVELTNEPNIDTIGLQQGDKVLKIQHNLNSLYVRVEIFDDKRSPFPLLYKCVDENNVYITFPSNIVDLSNSVDINDWFDFLASSLHSTKTVEGPGHNGKADTSSVLDTNKKFVAFVTAI